MLPMAEAEAPMPHSTGYSHDSSKGKSVGIAYSYLIKFGCLGFAGTAAVGTNSVKWFDMILI